MHRLATLVALVSFLSMSSGCSVAFEQRAPAAPRALSQKHPTARTGSYAAGGIAVAGAVAAITFTVLSAHQNSAVHDGGFRTAGDIQDTIDKGDRFNQYAFASGAIAIVAAAIATGLFFASTETDGDDGTTAPPPR